MAENEGYKFYKEVLGSPKHVLAPMVDQSELPFRKMSRELDVHLCYTPMWHAGIFTRDSKYRELCIERCPDDRPLLFQVNLFFYKSFLFGIQSDFYIRFRMFRDMKKL